MRDKLHTDELIKNALNEDMPMGDITTESTIAPGTRAKALLMARQDMVVAGLWVFERVFTLLDEGTRFVRHTQDGCAVAEGTVFMEIEGDAAVLLKGERTALNFLQHMSAIATKTAEFCKQVQDLPVKITDTRKTAPGLRYIEKYAVRAGGGYNHRFCLSDGVLLKDNHIKAAGGVAQAVKAAKAAVAHTVRIEVETETLQQVAEAIEAGADIIMFDNMSPEMMLQAVKQTAGRALTEASGDVTLDTVRKVALTGVDIISVGGLTHTVEAANISMKFL